MVLLKSLLAGIAAVALAAIAFFSSWWATLRIQRPPDTSGSVGVYAIALGRPATLLVVIGIFSVGFLWEFFRKRLRNTPVPGASPVLKWRDE